MSNISTIMFDLDGTLVDTDKLHYNALNAALEEVVGFTISDNEHQTTYKGLPTKTKLNMLLDLGKISQSHIEKIDELKQDKTIKAIVDFIKPDLQKIEMMEYLVSLNKKIIIVTNCSNTTTDLMLSLSDLKKYINFSICNGSWLPKPAKDPYIIALCRSGSRPENVICFEDSEKGYRSAVSAGLKCIVTDHNQLNKEFVQRYI